MTDFLFKKYSLSMLVLILIAGLCVPASTLTAQEPGSGQANLKIASVQDCPDGLRLTVRLNQITEDEILAVGWTYLDDVKGNAANQLLLTDLERGDTEIILPHVGLEVGDETQFGAVLTVNGAMLLFTFIATNGLQPAQNNFDFNDIIETVPAITQPLTVEDCTIEGETPTQSNADLNDLLDGVNVLGLLGNTGLLSQLLPQVPPQNLEQAPLSPNADDIDANNDADINDDDQDTD